MKRLRRATKKKISYSIIFTVISTIFLPTFAQLQDMQPKDLALALLQHEPIKIQAAEFEAVRNNLESYVFIGQQAHSLRICIDELYKLLDAHDDAPALRALHAAFEQGAVTASKEMVLDVLSDEAAAVLCKHHRKIAHDAQVEKLLADINSNYALVYSGALKISQASHDVHRSGISNLMVEQYGLTLVPDFEVPQFSDGATRAPSNGAGQIQFSSTGFVAISSTTAPTAGVQLSVVGDNSASGNPGYGTAFAATAGTGGATGNAAIFTGNANATAVTITPGTNQTGLSMTGNGTANAVSITAGSSTGGGLLITGGSGAGVPLQVTAAAGSGSAATITGNSTATALTVAAGTPASGTAIAANGNITLSSYYPPVNNTDVATKQYVDSISAGFEFKNACYASTTANLNATYNNGTAGVGATLTNAGTQVAFSTDGTSPAVNARILVQFQTSTFQNGIYTLTTVGSGSSNWVLTRATDYNTPAQIQPGDIVPVENGTLYADTLWLQTATVTTIGTDAITFTEFLVQGTINITGDSGGTLSGHSFTFTGGSTGLTFSGSGSTETLTGTLGVTNGGTGNATLTAHSILLGEGTSAVAFAGPGTAGQVLLAAGASADPAFITPTAGTGLSITTNATTLQYALSTPVSIANGGTNATSMTNTDGVVYYDGTKLNTTLVGTAGQLLTSNGAGSAPTFQTASGSSITITGDTGGAQTSGSFTFTGVGSTSGLYFAGASDVFTTSFQGATINAGAVNIGTDSTTNGINIGTATTTGGRAIAIGNTTTGTTIAENVGTSYILSGAAGASITLGTGLVAGTILIGGTAETGTITLGSSSAGNTIAVGAGAGATTVNIANGVSGNTISIGNGVNTSAQVVNIASGAAGASSTVNILNGVSTAGTQAVNIATGGAASTVTIGNTTSTSGIAENVGTGNYVLTGAATSNITLGTGLVGGAITIGGTAETGTITLGSSSATNTVAIGAGAGATTVNIATGAAANVVAIGSTAGTTTINSVAGGTTMTGVNGNTSVGASSAVLINSSSGVLGIATSSKRYKKNIQNLTNITHDFMALHPVSFNYIADASERTQYGLIAEEVEQTMPQLVIYNKAGQVETVQYHLLDAFLIKMIQDHQLALEKYEHEIAQLKNRIQILEQSEKID